jgi:VanZ family protein
MLNANALSDSAMSWPADVEINGALVYQTSMIQRISTAVGWLALAFIAFATLSPIDSRPVIASAQLEHFAAFGLVGLALGTAYPKRWLWVAAIVLGSAIALEALQLITPDRHGRLLDAAIKAAGGMCGIWASQIGVLIWHANPRRAS